MAKIPIGLQLYSVRGEVSKDLPATLKSVAGLGYVGVEPWGYGGDKLEWMGHAPKDIRRMLDDNGLKCCGIHLATGALLGDNMNRTILFGSNEACPIGHLSMGECWSILHYQHALAPDLFRVAYQYR